MDSVLLHARADCVRCSQCSSLSSVRDLRAVCTDTWWRHCNNVMLVALHAAGLETQVSLVAR